MTAEPLRYGRGALHALPDPPSHTDENAARPVVLAGRVRGGKLRFWVVERDGDVRYCLTFSVSIHRSSVHGLEAWAEGDLPTARIKTYGPHVPRLVSELYRGRIVFIRGTAKEFADGTGLSVKATDVQTFDSWRDVPAED